MVQGVIPKEAFHVGSALMEWITRTLKPPLPGRVCTDASIRPNPPPPPNTAVKRLRMREFLSELSFELV